MLAKSVLVRSQDLRSWARAPTCPLFAMNIIEVLMNSLKLNVVTHHV